MIRSIIWKYFFSQKFNFAHIDKTCQEHSVSTATASLLAYLQGQMRLGSEMPCNFSPSTSSSTVLWPLFQNREYMVLWQYFWGLLTENSLKIKHYCQRMSFFIPSVKFGSFLYCCIELHGNTSLKSTDHWHIP